MSKMGERQRPDNGGGNPPDRASSSESENKDSVNPPDNEKNNPEKSGNNPLSQLISDGIITEDQANKVMSALMGDRQNSNDTNKSTSSNITNQ